MTFKGFRCALLATAACAVPHGAMAQDSTAADATAEDASREIIVTANKRSESVQKVPSSIAVVGAADLERKNIAGVEQLSTAVPGFVYRGGFNPTNTSLSIRGISTLSFSRSIEPSVGTVIDGVVIGLQGPNLFNFNDVSRVEVLRGPQGTLFGINASAGILNIATEEPGNDLSVKVGASYAQRDQVDLYGAVGGPLAGDKLRLRVSGYYKRYDDYVDNLNTGESLNGDEQYGLRAKLIFEPDDLTKMTINADAAWDRSDCCSPVFIKLVPGRSNAFDTQFYGPLTPESNQINLPGSTFSKSNGFGFSAQWDRYLGEHMLTSITAYRDYYIEAETTVVQPSLILPSNFATAKQSQLSQELRLASPTGGAFDYVVGGFYFKQLKSGSIDQKIRLRANGFQQQNHLVFADADNANYALFGEGNFHPTSDLTLIAGARWTKFQVSFRNIGQPREPGYFVVNLAPGETIQDSVSAEKWTWKLGARWQMTPNDMIYATASRGIKGPAFNTLATNVTGPQRVRPEIATNYEIGFKGSLFDNRVRTSLSLFSTTFKDFQAQAVETDPISGLRTFVLVNAGKIRTRGIEGSVNIYPTDTTSVDASLSYIDAKFQDFPGGQCYSGQTAAQGCVGGVQDLKGARLPANPKWSFNIGGEQLIKFAGAPFDGFVNLNYNWRGKIQWDIFQDPEAIEDSVGLLSGAVGIRAKDRRYSLSLFAKNLTNKFYTNGLTPGTAIVGFIPLDYRRQVGVKLSYSY